MAADGLFLAGRRPIPGRGPIPDNPGRGRRRLRHGRGGLLSEFIVRHNFGQRDQGIQFVLRHFLFLLNVNMKKLFLHTDSN